VPTGVAVDLGGTNIRAAMCPTAEPTPSAIVRVATRAAEGPDAVIGRIIQAIEEVSEGVEGGIRIGLGAPGPLDPKRGIVIEAPNLPGWLNIPLRDRLEQHFEVPVALGNDANLAALGEWRHGAGRGTHNLMFLILGTGIGGGVIIDDHLLVGTRGMAAELGHMTVRPDGPMCGCGQRGHLEAVASGPAIGRQAQERVAAGEASMLRAEVDRGRTLTAEDVGRAALAGDALAREVVAEAGAAIGLHLANLVHAFNPEIIVFGGGVSQIGAPLFGPMEEALRRHVMHPAYLDGLRMERAALGDDAGLIGAMVLARES
jgi:glucokinase